MTSVDTWDADTVATRALRLAMVQSLAAAGELQDPAWRGAFAAVPRHALVPVYYQGHDYSQVDATADADRDAWLSAVYSDETLITQITPHTVTSSGTMPSLLAEMLQELRVWDRDRVLQIGTGTGYTAGLLCARLTSAQVTTIDIDPELVGTAQQRLAGLGYQPTCVVADGADGYPDGAPYDRIIATCALPAIPSVWLAQTRLGGRIVAPIATGLAALDVQDAEHATGRFLPSAGYFMPRRSTVTAPPSPQQPPPKPRRAARVTEFGPLDTVFHQHIRFVLAVAVPEIRFGQHGPRLTDVIAYDGAGSWARLHAYEDGAYRVSEDGHRRLWAEVEYQVRQWRAWGEPARERFGLTISPTGQRVWLDQPDGTVSWVLNA